MMSPMVRWLDYDPIASVVLALGVCAIPMIAFSM